MARPSKLDDVLQGKLVARIRAGAFAEQAARACGIAPSTFYAWQARGRAAIASGTKAKAEQPFVSLVEALDEALADAEIHATTVLRAAMGDDWRAAAWYLERRHPKRWSRKAAEAQLDEGAGDVDAPPPVDVEVGAPEVTAAAHDFLRSLTGQS